ncbi:hypothetical protein [Bacillus toyonensis]|uniref:hypothetical protein n=1 Tax=Bacillus toyonensis TaxID=155322 RepID=UPI002E1F9FB1|nr:hypothetical protein [Bacillus toyonensis]
MAYSKAEQETVLVFDNEIREWKVYTAVPKHIRKLMELGKEIKVMDKDEKGTPIAIQCILSEKNVTLRKERVLTEEQRQRIAERMRKMS